MKSLPLTVRLCALSVGLIGFAGLAIRFSVTLEQAGSVVGALWVMLRFFTIIGNALMCVLLFGVALGVKAAAQPQRQAGIMLFMALIGAVYVALLRGTEALSGPAATANLLLHYMAPPAMALYWLICVPKGKLAYADALRWTLIPLTYLGYALTRAHYDGRYPYPFLDVAKQGWAQVGLTVALISLGFIAVGTVLVWFDRRLRR